MKTSIFIRNTYCQN